MSTRYGYFTYWSALPKGFKMRRAVYIVKAGRFESVATYDESEYEALFARLAARIRYIDESLRWDVIPIGVAELEYAFVDSVRSALTINAS